MKMNGNSQLFSLRWNNYLGHITGAFETLRSGEDFVDVTLSCEGKKIKAHKMLLSACSSYFKEIFKDNPCQHPVIVFRNVRYTDLVALINFIYQGEVNVVQEQLSSFLATAELLAIKGLTDCNDSDKIKEDEWEYEQEEITPTVHINSTDSPISLTPINKGGTDSKTLISKKRSNEQNVYEYHDLEQNFVRSKKSSKPPPLSALSDNGKQSVEIIPVLSGSSLVTDQKNNNIPYSSVEPSMNQRDSSKFISSEEPMLSELDIDDDMTPNVEVEIRHLPTKPAVSEVEANQESIQGHWLSSLNNNNSNHNNNNSNCNNNNHNNNNSNSNNNNNNNNNVSNNNENTNNEAENQKHRHICNICGATYKHLRNLRAHCHLHYGKTKCNLCDKVLCNISYFKKHLQQQHGLLTDYTNKKKFEINK